MAQGSLVNRHTEAASPPVVSWLHFGKNAELETRVASESSLLFEHILTSKHLK